MCFQKAFRQKVFWGASVTSLAKRFSRGSEVILVVSNVILVEANGLLEIFHSYYIPMDGLHQLDDHL